PSRSSSSRSASRSTKRRTIPATSTSTRSSSSFRTSVRSRSNGPSKASRSSSSSRTIMRRRLARRADAPFGHGHCGPLGDDPRGAWPISSLLAAPDELPPDEERGGEHEQHRGDPGVHAQRPELVRGIDPDQPPEEAPEAVG